MDLADILLLLGLGYLGYLVITGMTTYGATPPTPDQPAAPNILQQITSAFTGNLTPNQIAQYAQNAGFTGPNLDISVAIALAESSGNPNATGALGEVGLWQIYPAAHPEFGPNFNALYDPQLNANAAFSVYQKAGGFTPWSTYPTTYLSYMPQVQAALGG
jgi:hypothetical protein